MSKERQNIDLSMEHQALLQAFLAEETARGRRPRGVTRLRYCVPYFLRFLEERGKRATETTVADAYEYQGELMGRTERPLAAGTVLSVVAAASAFCSYLVRSGSKLGNPFQVMKHPKREKRIPRGVLNEQDMNTLLETLLSWQRPDILWNVKRRYVTHVMAELQYASGLRISEVAALTPKDIDLDRALVHVKEGKHGSDRYAFLTDYACAVLELYIARIRPLCMTEQNASHRDTLFLCDWKRLSINENEELKRACSEAGVAKISSHGFRHALGYHLLRAGCPLRYIQAILGHKRLRETEAYTRVDAADVKRVFDACHPRMHG
jgi:site-specific recombinase XerD